MSESGCKQVSKHRVTFVACCFLDSVFVSTKMELGKLLQAKRKSSIERNLIKTIIDIKTDKITTR